MRNQEQLGKKYKIEHLGKTVSTDFLDTTFTDKECDKLRQEFYQKPDIVHVINSLIKVRSGSTYTASIMKYFINDLLFDTVLYRSNWSVNEFMSNNDLIRHFHARMKLNKKVYEYDEEYKNLDTFFRIAGGNIASKPTNYPIKSVDHIIKKYCPKNDNYYDPSCGWGIRLLSAMRNSVNYFGTEPNDKLVNKLNDMHGLYDAANNVASKVDIRCQGSEKFIPDWENTMGLVFTSPPYFGLEDYKTGEHQSFKPGMGYQDWLDSFMKLTVNNAAKYLIQGGHLAINISDYEKYKLFDNTKKLCYDNDQLVFVEDLDLKLNHRPNPNENRINKNERIMVFMKK